MCTTNFCGLNGMHCAGMGISLDGKATKPYNTHIGGQKSVFGVPQIWTMERGDTNGRIRPVQNNAEHIQRAISGSEGFTLT